MSYMTVSDITAGYGKENIISGVSFTLEEGELMGVIGANGSGKTTLLKAICGILPHVGSCLLGDGALENLSPKQIAGLVSYIPQRSGISIDISALDVVLMGFNPKLGILAHPTGAMKACAIDALAQVGLSGKEETNYLHLSEGQKQLCIFARTLAADCRLLLMDEPESALDFRFRHLMMKLICKYIRTEKRCGIISLHDPALALNYCDRLLLLSDGKVLDVVAPKEESLEEMSGKLSGIYGPVTLQRCDNGSGGVYTVMVPGGNL